MNVLKLSFFRIAFWGISFAALVQSTASGAISFHIDDFDLYSYQEEIVITASGLTMYLTNPNSPDGDFLVDYDGIYLSPEDGYGQTTSFDISFDQDVIFESYEIGYVYFWGTSGYFNLINPNGVDSQNNSLNAVGEYFFNDPFILYAGQTARFEALFSHPIDVLSQLKVISVAVVPEPSTYGLILGAGVFMLVFLRRRKASQGRDVTSRK